jgi:hypothetical protein
LRNLNRSRSSASCSITLLTRLLCAFSSSDTWSLCQWKHSARAEVSAKDKFSMRRRASGSEQLRNTLNPIAEICGVQRGNATHFPWASESCCFAKQGISTRSYHPQQPQAVLRQPKQCDCWMFVISHIFASGRVADQLTSSAACVANPPKVGRQCGVRSDPIVLKFRKACGFSIPGRDNEPKSTPMERRACMFCSFEVIPFAFPPAPFKFISHPLRLLNYPTTEMS